MFFFCFSPWFEPDVDGGVEDTDDGEGEEVVGGARHDRVVPAGLRQQVNLAIEIPFQHVGEVPETYMHLIDCLLFILLIHLLFIIFWT